MLVRAARSASALARSCHPAPTVAVTVFAVLLAVAANDAALTCLIVGVAVLCGQLSIGWSNDRIDAGRDRAVRRTDKPLATGELAVERVDVAIAVALVGCLGFSLALGWRAGLLHLFAVGCGWTYNVWLKGTWWSWLPYALAFGALPAVATYAGSSRAAPAAWVVVAGALLGVTANLTNALPELDADEATGIRGLPHRLGPRVSLLLATALLVVSTLVIVVGPPGPPTVVGWTALGVDLVAAGICVVVFGRRPTSRVTFYGLMLVVACDMVLIVIGGRL